MFEKPSLAERYYSLSLLLFLWALPLTAQNNLPDYKEILLPNERLNIEVIDQMLVLDHRISNEAIHGDWQVLKGRINTFLPDSADNAYMEFSAWEEIVMTFEADSNFYLDGIIDLSGTWDLQSNNTVLHLRKIMGKRVDEEFHRVFIEDDIMHLIVRDSESVVYMVLQKKEAEETEVEE